MSIHNLKPWTELVKLHPDVESGTLTEAMFALDLGAVAMGDPTAPKVYRWPAPEKMCQCALEGIR